MVNFLSLLKNFLSNLSSLGAGLQFVRIGRVSDLQSGFIKITKSALISYLIVFLALSGSGLFLFNPFGTKTTEAAWLAPRSLGEVGFNDKQSLRDESLNWGYV